MQCLRRAGVRSRWSRATVQACGAAGSSGAGELASAAAAAGLEPLPHPGTREQQEAQRDQRDHAIGDIEGGEIEEEHLGGGQGEEGQARRDADRRCAVEAPRRTRPAPGRPTARSGPPDPGSAVPATSVLPPTCVANTPTTAIDRRYTTATPATMRIPRSHGPTGNDPEIATNPAMTAATATTDWARLAHVIPARPHDQHGRRRDDQQGDQPADASRPDAATRYSSRPRRSRSPRTGPARSGPTHRTTTAQA